MTQNYYKVLQRIAAMLLLSGLVFTSPTTMYANQTESDGLSTLSKIDEQKRTIKGVVLEASTGEPIVGATVIVKGTTIASFTDENGMYSINFTANNPVLVASMMGYNSAEVAVGTKTDINFQLEFDAFALEDVVVVASGVQKKESVVGAISNLEVDKLKLPTANLSTSLGGQLAGIVSVQSSGEPGSSAEFYIRGIATFGANKNPLVLVDGVERSLDLVDVEDIAAFSILKDASATAVYGVRGANGVILIQTKKGEVGKPAINVKYEHGVLSPIKMPDLVDSYDFATHYNEALGQQYFNDTALEQYRMSSSDPNRDNNLYPDVNWLDEMFKNQAQNQRLTASVSGGGEIARYYISGAYYNEGSIFMQDEMANYDSSIRYQKTNFRANVDVNLFPTTVLDVSLANIFEQINEPGHAKSDIWYYGFNTSPNAFPAYYTDDNGDWLAWSGPQQGSGHNPYNALYNSGYNEVFKNSTQASVSLKQDLKDIVEGLTARVTYSWDAWNYNNIKRYKEVPQFIAQGRDENGNLILNQAYVGSNTLGYETGRGGNGANGNTNYLEAVINYDKTFGEQHNVSAMAMYNHKIKNLVGVDNNYSSLPYKNQGVAARVTYNYDMRYFVELNAGYNGSENFSPGNRFGLFPAVAAGWMVTNEDFMQSVSGWLSLLKLKASYGIVGNDQIGGSRRFIYNPTISTGLDGYEGMGVNGDYNPGGIAVGEVANPNVGWEESEKTNIGIELGFMDNALRLYADFFHEHRSGIFMQRGALPSIAGISTTPWVNVGEMKNQGFDATLEYMQRFGEVEVTAQGNFTFAENEILNNDEPDWEYTYQNRIGESSGQPFGLIADGLFVDEADIASSPVQTFGSVRPGDIKYRDINGDARIDASDMVPIGYTSLPEIIYGFGATVAYKGFSLNFLFQGIGNSSIFLGGGTIRPFEGGNVQRSNFNSDLVGNVWTTQDPDPNATYPRMSTVANANNSQTSTFWMRNRAYLRLKNAEISYTLPRSLVSKAKLGSARIYIQGLNLLTFSEFKLWDPENGGGEGATYPLNRVFNIGIQLSY